MEEEFDKKWGRLVAPVDWPGLIESERARTEAALASLGGTLLYLSRRNAKDRVLPELPLLHRAAVILGPDAVRPLLPKLAAAFVAELKSLGEFIEISSAANLVVCAGEKTPPGGAQLFRALEDIPASKRALSVQNGQTLGLAAICLGSTQRVPAFVGGGRLPRRFREAESFGFDAAGFIRYLATASAAKVPAAKVEAAWQSFLGAFPAKLATGSLHWRDLMWAARAVHAVIGRAPLGETAERLHAAVLAQPAAAHGDERVA